MFDVKTCKCANQFINQYFKIGLIVIVCSFYYSCKNTVPFMIPEQEIAFHFSNNQSYQFEIEETNETVNTIGEVPIRDTFVTQTSLLYHIRDSVNERYNAWARFSKIEKLDKSNGLKEDEPGPFEQSLKAFDGALLNITLTPKGEVAAISGYEELAEKSIYIYNSVNDEHTKSSFPFILEKVFFLDIFDQITNTLCCNSVIIGTTWERNEAEVLGEDKNIKSIYKCDKIQDGIAYITSSGGVEKVVTYNNKTIVLKGFVDGKYELDANTGILIRSKRFLEMSGSTMINSVNFGMSIRKTITIDGRRTSDTALLSLPEF